MCSSLCPLANCITRSPFGWEPLSVAVGEEAFLLSWRVDDFDCLVLICESYLFNAICFSVWWLYMCVWGAAGPGEGSKYLKNFTCKLYDQDTSRLKKYPLYPSSYNYFCLLCPSMLSLYPPYPIIYTWCCCLCVICVRMLSKRAKFYQHAHACTLFCIKMLY